MSLLHGKVQKMNHSHCSRFYVPKDTSFPVQEDEGLVRIEVQIENESIRQFT